MRKPWIDKPTLWVALPPRGSDVPAAASTKLIRLLDMPPGTRIRPYGIR